MGGVKKCPETCAFHTILGTFHKYKRFSTMRFPPYAPWRYIEHLNSSSKGTHIISIPTLYNWIFLGKKKKIKILLFLSNI